MVEPFDVVDLIRTKRDHGALSGAQIEWMVDAYTRGYIADEQMSAMTMAIFLNGMERSEIRDLTLAMVASGERLDFSGLRKKTTDKHSTGGVGDKITLPLAPLVWDWIGTQFINPHDLLHVVTLRGFRARWLLPLGCYFVPVNAILEELFWRGVILNELRGTGDAAWTVGAGWAILAFGAWHYLVLRLLLRPGWAEASVLLIVAAGIFLAWLYRATRSIVVPILWHSLVFDLALIVIFAAVLHAK